MGYSKMYVFEPSALTNLLVHYTDGLVPLVHTVGNVGVNPMLQRFIGFEVLSEEWETSEPLHLRYEGKRVMSWTKDGSGADPLWAQRNETPQRQ